MRKYRQEEGMEETAVSPMFLLIKDMFIVCIWRLIINCCYGFIFAVKIFTPVGNDCGLMQYLSFHKQIDVVYNLCTFGTADGVKYVMSLCCVGLVNCTSHLLSHQIPAEVVGSRQCHHQV